MALSPASTRSIRMMAIRADHQGAEKSSMFTLQHASHDEEIRRRISGLIEAGQEKKGVWCSLELRTPRSHLYRFQSKVWLDMQCRCMSDKPEVQNSVMTT
jgi:hypothetical protein